MKARWKITGISKHADASNVTEMKRKRNCDGQACLVRGMNVPGGEWAKGERGKCFQEISNVCKNQEVSLCPSEPQKRSGCG